LEHSDICVITVTDTFDTKLFVQSKSLEIAFQIDLYNQIASMAFMPLQNSKFFACGGLYALALLVNWSSVKNLQAGHRKKANLRVKQAGHRI